MFVIKRSSLDSGTVERQNRDICWFGFWHAWISDIRALKIWLKLFGFWTFLTLKISKNGTLGSIKTGQMGQNV